MNKKQIAFELTIQEQVEGKNKNIEILRKFLEIVNFSSQWQSFVKCKYYSYGKLSYECYKFHYPTKELIKLFEK